MERGECYNVPALMMDGLVIVAEARDGRPGKKRILSKGCRQGERRRIDEKEVAQAAGGAKLNCDQPPRSVSQVDELRERRAEGEGQGDGVRRARGGEGEGQKIK